MISKVLTEMCFSEMLGGAYSQTQTGQTLLDHYRAYLMTNSESHTLINNFVKEASNVSYDNGIHDVLENVTEYINEHKTLWAIASACEAIESSNGRYNILDKQAVNQAVKLLEMSENDCVKWIRGGALKNITYCEPFRNIAKSVYRDRPVVEQNTKYTRITPIAYIENVGDTFYFNIEGTIYESNGKYTKVSENPEVSNTFNTINRLLESNICMVREDEVVVDYNNVTYIVKEQNNITHKCKDTEKDMNVAQFRESCRLTLSVTNPALRNKANAVFESIALLSENFDNMVKMDNAAIYMTQNDKFLVIESGNKNLYATLLESSHAMKWTINENAITALEYIKKQTNTELISEYSQSCDNVIEEAHQEARQEMLESINESQCSTIKERIAMLSEKFKNDKVKLAVLNNLASQIKDIENE